MLSSLFSLRGQKYDNLKSSKMLIYIPEMLTIFTVINKFVIHYPYTSPDLVYE